nr:G-type lectin S-receptor-like serine/threonine-protein kinase At4g27290 [Ipomoea batatas]
MGNDVPLLVALMLLVSIQKISSARDSITSTQFLKDGETIVSSGGIFELGFFSPTNSLNRYVGIWYKRIPVFTVVWVANRDTPITNTSSVVFQIIRSGRLALVEGNNSILWHTNTSILIQNPVAKLLDSGNLVITDGNENFLWQSFYHPTDTLLPGMIIGKNFHTGVEISLSSWKTQNNPGMGKLGTITQTFVIANTTAFLLYFKVFNSSGLVRAIISSSGTLQFYLWEDGSEEWNILYTAPTDICDRYGYCGANGICYYDNYPSCSCLDNFLPKNAVGCVRRTPLSCGNGSSDGFLKYSGLKFPDTKLSWFNSSMNLKECEKFCLKNCNCTAYSSLDISNGEHGCLIWFGDLIDLRMLPGQDLYIRMAASDLDYTSSSKGKKLNIVKLTSSLLIVPLALSLVTMIMKFYKRKWKEMKPVQPELLLVEDQTLFEASTITRATENFSIKNKIGEGGYGPVYKGVLDDGREIAVKRLSKTSTQGLEEFKNEVNFIAKLQHRNLVNLLGWCIKGEEMLLIYEYMPNKSLDSFIFGILKSSTLLHFITSFKI